MVDGGDTQGPGAATNDPDEIPADPSESIGPRMLGLAGVGFIYGAVAVFGAVCFRLFSEKLNTSARWYDFFPEYILTAIGVFGSILGVRMLRSIGVGRVQPSRVINKVEWDALCAQVQAGQEDAITQYIRLTSLTGFTGAFTKLGLTGLPLATIGLTLFFSLLSIQYPTFFDLAKLTLGAFIGSFVQKQVNAGQTSSVKLPSGEKVSLTSTLPYST